MNKYCPDCGKKIDKRSKRCNSCARKGKLHPNWKNGISLKKNYCIDCGKEISLFPTMRCSSCAKIKYGLCFIIGTQFKESKNYTCEKCGFQELPEEVQLGKYSRIHAHHIIRKEDASEEINDFSNLCCLCCSCHKKYHCENKGNINKKSLMEFLKNE